MPSNAVHLQKRCARYSDAVHTKSHLRQTVVDASRCVIGDAARTSDGGSDQPNVCAPELLERQDASVTATVRGLILLAVWSLSS
jgi:hypothetical protein